MLSGGKIAVISCSRSNGQVCETMRWNCDFDHINCRTKEFQSSLVDFLLLSPKLQQLNYMYCPMYCYRQDIAPRPITQLMPMCTALQYTLQCLSTRRNKVLQTGLSLKNGCFWKGSTITKGRAMLSLLYLCSYVIQWYWTIMLQNKFCSSNFKTK